MNKVGGKKDLQYGISSGLTRVLERKERRRRKTDVAAERGQEEKKEKKRKRKKLKGATKWR